MVKRRLCRMREITPSLYEDENDSVGREILIMQEAERTNARGRFLSHQESQDLCAI